MIHVEAKGSEVDGQQYNGYIVTYPSAVVENLIALQKEEQL